MILTLFFLVISVSANPLNFPPNITILKPNNNTVFLSSNLILDINWTSNETVNNFTYSLDDTNRTFWVNNSCEQERFDIFSCYDVNGNWSVEETENALLWQYVFDNDWDTGTDSSNGNHNLFINYSKPLSAFDASIKYRWGTSFSNSTYDVPDACFNYTNYSGVLRLRYLYSAHSQNDALIPYCWNSTGWLAISSDSHGENPGFQDEAIIWNVSRANLTRLDFSQNRGKHNVSVYGKNNNQQIGQSTYNYFYVNSKPNISNLTISPLPVSGNLKGHCNFTDANTDATHGGDQTYWYLNNSLLLTANNTNVLLSGNVTNNANITYSCRVNDTYEWSDWMNSSTATAGDVSAPVLNSYFLQYSSLNNAAGNTNNLSINASDDFQVSTITFNITTPIANLTRSFSFNPSQSVISSYLLFESSESLILGNYNITSITMTDGNGNIFVNYTTLKFFVSLSPSVSNAGGGGGGTIFEASNLSLKFKPALISTNFLYTPFNSRNQTFSIAIQTNKPIKECLSAKFVCTIEDKGVTLIVSRVIDEQELFYFTVEEKIKVIAEDQESTFLNTRLNVINAAYEINGIRLYWIILGAGIVLILIRKATKKR